MSRANDISARKADHVDIVLDGGVRAFGTTGLETVRFEPAALPEMHLNEVSLAVSFLGRALKAPLLISSMTGGFAKGAQINHHLAEAAQRRGIAFAVGSQRIAIENGEAAELDRTLRLVAPDIPIYANFGAAQLTRGYGVKVARQLMDLIEGDALIVHLNALHEAVQTEGDRDWSGILAALEQLAARLERPVIVKEVGFGISARVARQLRECGVAAIDVAGAGGTNWALVESRRAASGEAQAVAAAFADWGIPTARAIREVREACPGLPLIGSGGLRTGVDAAKAIRLGADLAGIASGLLEAATISSEAVDAKLGVIIDQLRIACFCTGSRSLAELRTALLME